MNTLKYKLSTLDDGKILWSVDIHEIIFHDSFFFRAEKATLSPTREFAEFLRTHSMYDQLVKAIQDMSSFRQSLDFRFDPGVFLVFKLAFL